MREWDLLTKWQRYIELEYIEELKKMLKQWRFSVDLPLDRGLTGLYYAILEDKNKSAFFLIEYGADLDIKNHRGLTPLMLAVLRRNMDVCKAMVHYGADFGLTDEKDKNALYYAIQNNEENIVRLFINQGCRSIHPDFISCRELLKYTTNSMFILLSESFDQFDNISKKALSVERLRRIFK